LAKTAVASCSTGIAWGGVNVGEGDTTSVVPAVGVRAGVNGDGLGDGDRGGSVGDGDGDGSSAGDELASTVGDGAATVGEGNVGAGAEGVAPVTPRMSS
jgi:hypothetical protein